MCRDPSKLKGVMSILSDGSQARKTGKEKELVLIRCERNGIPDLHGYKSP